MDRNVSPEARQPPAGVALRKESVDRNFFLVLIQDYNARVALRKESVDRNIYIPVFYACDRDVALRKESVDRNSAPPLSPSMIYCRSPQGERG